MDKQTEKQFYEELDAMAAEVNEATTKAAQAILDKIKEQSKTYGEAARKVQLLNSSLRWSGKSNGARCVAEKACKLLDEEMRNQPIKRDLSVCITLDGNAIAGALLEPIKEGC